VNSGQAEVVTTRTLWAGTILFAAIVAALVPALLRLIPRHRFLSLKAHVVILSGLFWAGLWLAVVTAYWQAVYGLFFPSWSRWLLPPFFGVLYGAAAWCLWFVASRSRVHPVIAFVGFGAALGPITHVWAVSRGLVEKAPMLRAASPVMAVVISVPEFGLYWCLILLLAVLIRRLHSTISPAA
jgi:hypothetical protein